MPALTPDDLSEFAADPTPVWVFDVNHHRMLWANGAALAFWRANSLQELQTRDYSTDSRAIKERLDHTMRETREGTWRRSSWTLYPLDQPITVLLDACLYEYEGARAIVFRLASELERATADPDGLRMMVSARTTPVGASIFDLDGALVSENPASLALRHRFPAWGSTAVALEPRYASREAAERILAAISADTIDVFDFELEEGDERVFLTVTARRIRDPVTGQPAAHITEEDVTEKTHLTRSLALLNEELEQRVEERTLEVVRLHEHFRQAQKLELIGRLTGGVAHDFNNLLAVVRGAAEYMQIGKTYDEEATREIVAAAARGADLTRSLLAYARLQPLSIGPVDVAEVLNDSLRMLRRALGVDVRVLVREEPLCWLASTDEGQLKDAILNLALNARDAMPDGGQLMFEIRNTLIAPGDGADDALTGEFVVLTVKDTGVGMSEEVLAKADEPFFTTKSIGRGSGLGLSMVSGFVRQCGGDLSIRSEAKDGTEVRLLLPRCHDGAAPQKRVFSSREAARGQGEHIVLVEDSATLRAILKRTLVALGYRVSDFPEAAYALRFLRSYSDDVDLLLTDIVLPGGMNGVELVQAVESECPKVRRLMMSGHSEWTNTGAGSAERHGRLLSKPVGYQALAEALRTALGG